MSTEPKKIKIKQALQICKDIEALHKMDDVRRIYHSSYGYKSKNFEVRVANNQNEISEIEVTKEWFQSQNVSHVIFGLYCSTLSAIIKWIR